MIIVLFHVLYLVGKFVYKKYRVNKQKAIDDATACSSTPEPITISQHDYKRFDIDSLSDYGDQKPDIRFSPPAYMQRYFAVQDVLNDAQYQGKLRKVVDFGCSELGFLVYLKNTVGIEEILCVDIDRNVLESHMEKAAPLTYEYLHCRIAPLVISIYEGSIADRDKVLEKTDAVICIELIEHLYPDSLTEFPINVFGYIKPKVAIVTTPNADFNVLFPNLRGFRHPDHKFEWTREQFQSWAENIVLRYPDYSVTFHGICQGPPGTEHLGACTQMAIFHREEEQPADYPIGIDNLFKLVSSYEYPQRVDNRSDEQKILDEAAYYIYQLSSGRENPCEEVSLERLLQFLTKFSVTLPALRTILEEAGWIVEEGDSGPVVLVTNPSSHSDISLDETWTDDEGTHDIDSIYNESIGNDDAWNDEPGLPDIVYVPPNMNSESWDAEPSIIIPCLNPVELQSELGLSLHTDTDSSNPDTTRSSTQMTSDDLDGSQNSATMASLFNISMMFKDFPDLPQSPVNNLSLNDIVDHSSTPQNDSLELRYTPGSNRTLDFCAQMSVSRSSTSPPPLAEPLCLMESDESMMNNTFRHCSIGVMNLDEADEYLSESLETKESDTFDPRAKSRYESFDGALPTDQHADTASPTGINNCMIDSAPQYTSSPRIVAKRGRGRGILRARRRTDVRRGSAISKLSAASQPSQNCSNMSTTPIESPFVIGTWCPGDENIKHVTDIVELNSENDTANKFDTENASQITLPLPTQTLNKPALGCEKTANSVENKFVTVEKQQTNDKYVVPCEPQTCVKVNTDGYVPSTEDTSHIQQSIAVSYAEHINKLEIGSESLSTDNRQSDDAKFFVNCSTKEKSNSANSTLRKCTKPLDQTDDSPVSEKAQINEHDLQTLSACQITQLASVTETEGLRVKLPSPESLELSTNSWSPEIGDSGYPNSASAQDITPEYDVSSIAQDQISDSESSSAEEAPRVEFAANEEAVENNDLVNNNRNYEDVDVEPEAGVNEIDVLQPLIDDLENDIANENDIYALENEFPLWLLRILDIPNPVDIQEQAFPNRELLRQPNVVAGREEPAFARVDEGFDSSNTFDDGNETDDEFELQNDFSNDDDDDDAADITHDDQNTDDDGDDGDDEYENEVYEGNNMNNINNIQDARRSADEFSKKGGDNAWAAGDT